MYLNNVKIFKVNEGKMQCGVEVISLFHGHGHGHGQGHRHGHGLINVTQM